MQPILYSLILNLVTLLLCGGLAFQFNAPWLVVVAILIQTHALERFRSNAPDPADQKEEQPMGFTADLNR